LLDPHVSNNEWRAASVQERDDSLWLTLIARMLGEVALFGIL
jgi:hypothetical protein